VRGWSGGEGGKGTRGQKKGEVGMMPFIGVHGQEGDVVITQPELKETGHEGEGHEHSRTPNYNA